MSHGTPLIPRTENVVDQLVFDALDEAPATSENLLIQGDADDGLPELLQRYESRVRLVLTDPPYNTTSRFFHYGDSRTPESWLRDRERHARLLHALLRHDGSLWMHLDDSEMHYCKVMLDRIFGRANFVASVVWQKNLSRDNRTDISTTHEYLLVYAKDRRTWARSRNSLPSTPEQLNRYRNPDDDPRGPWTSGDLTAKAGPGRRQAQFFDVTTPSGRVVRPAHGMAWRLTRERFDELLADGRITFGDGNQVPRLKRFLRETQGGLVPTTWWAGTEVGTTDVAKKQLRRLFPDLVPFETPKPEQLAHRVITIASDPGDIVLDCYAGSGTTPAVAHKMRRHWIAIEREPRVINEFLKPRLDQVISGEDVGGVSGICAWHGGGAFEHRISTSSLQAQPELAALAEGIPT